MTHKTRARLRVRIISLFKCNFKNQDLYFNFSFARKMPYIIASFFFPLSTNDDENATKMKFLTMNVCISFATSLCQKTPTLPLDPRPLSPLINTLWLYLISHQYQSSLSVVKQLDTALEGEENMHCGKGSRTGGKTSINSSKTMYFHASLS